MTENQLRQKVVKIAVSYLGCKEADGSHRKIIDLYNSHKPLARGYAVKYTDAWCSTFASAVAIAAGLTDIIPTECGCEKHIGLFKKLGAWVENDAYVPKPGDYIFYDWQDGTNYATTDNTGAADHVGIVTEVNGSTITVIEGNMSDAVGYRHIAVNGRYIRGYGVPKYASKATGTDAGTTGGETGGTGNTGAGTCKVGDIVNFTGGKHYTNANAATGTACKPGKAKVTQVYQPGKAKHPYHLVAVSGGGSTVYGWVDAADIGGSATGGRYAVGAGKYLSRKWEPLQGDHAPERPAFRDHPCWAGVEDACQIREEDVYGTDAQYFGHRRHHRRADRTDQHHRGGPETGHVGEDAHEPAGDHRRHGADAGGLLRVYGLHGLRRHVVLRCRRRCGGLRGGLRCHVRLRQAERSTRSDQEK